MESGTYSVDQPRRWVFGSLVGHVGITLLFSMLGAAFLKPPPPLQLLSINLQTLQMPSREEPVPQPEQPKPVEPEVEVQPELRPPQELRTTPPTPVPDAEAGLPQEELESPTPAPDAIEVPPELLIRPQTTPDDVDFLEPEVVQSARSEVDESVTSVTAPDPELVAPGASVQASASEGVDDTYLRLVQQKIGRRWRPTDAGTRGLRDVSCVVSFRIGPAGDVIAPTVTRSSGLSVFDRSSLSAIVNSAPLPRPPARFGATGLEIDFLFNYAR